MHQEDLIRNAGKGKPGGRERPGQSPPFVLQRLPGICIAGVRVLYANDIRASGSPSFHFGKVTPILYCEVHLEHLLSACSAGVCFLYSDGARVSQSPSLLFCKGYPEFVWPVSAFCIQMISGLLGHPPFILARSPRFCIEVHLEHLPAVRSGCPLFVFKLY
jgi:hypothetical protein